MAPAPTSLATARLALRRPTLEDAPSIFAFASDPEVTRYVGWPTHRGIEDSERFLKVAGREWEDNGVGAYLIALEGAVIGTTGLHRLAAHRATTGYVLARDAWRRGYATEACRAMVQLGRELGFVRIEALCHVDHSLSVRVLESAELTFEGILRRHSIFPNLTTEAQHVGSYAWTAERALSSSAQSD